MTDESPTIPEGINSWTCYKHPKKNCGVRCNRCERPICADCMISAPVGFQCRECVNAAPPVMSIRSLPINRPLVTLTIIVVAVVAFLPSLAGGSNIINGNNKLAEDLALFGPLVAEGEWWRLMTSGFVHYGLMHLGFNMAILYQLGSQLEPVLGRFRFLLVYLAGLIGGSLGALVLSPLALTGGASGAVFGLMGATLVLLQSQGRDLRQSGLVTLLVVNLVITFVVPGISIGGHLGGLGGGALAGWLMVAGKAETLKVKRSLGPAELVGIAMVLVLMAGTFVGAIFISSNPL